MNARFIKPILVVATLLLVAGPNLAAQDPKAAKDVPTVSKDAKKVTKSPKSTPKPTASGNPMLGDQNVTAPPSKRIVKAQKKSKKIPYENRVDINNASKDDLKKLQGITDEYAAKIIAGRPYRSKAALAVDRIIPTTVYYLIKDKVTAGKIVSKP